MRLFKKEIKAKSWSDVTLNQLQEIESLPSYDDELDMMINQISILKDMDPAEIENMRINDLIEEFNQWSFLKELPKEKNHKIITINGQKLGSMDFNDLTLGQLADIEEYFTDGLMKNLHKILSIIYLPTKTYNKITKKYTLEDYVPDKERQNLFLSLTMDILYPQVLFFCHIVRIYLEGLAISLAEKTPQEIVKIMKMKNELEVLENHKH